MRLPTLLPVLCLAAPWFLAATPSRAELRPEKVHVADAKKNQSYIRDGLFVGGDRAINGVTVKDIRHATNPGFERVVIDLQGTLNGEPAAIERAPYYQLAVNPDEKRLVVTIWGKPRLEFDAKKVLAGFRKSAAVDKVTLLPKVEDDAWTFMFELKGEAPVEVFELGNPVRVIVDIKTAAAAPAPKAHKRAPRARTKAHPPAESSMPALDPEMDPAPEDHG